MIVRQSWVCLKQWLLAPHLPDALNTRVNLAGRVKFFSKMAFGKYLWVWQVLTKRFGICRRVWRVLNFSDKGHFGECDYLINMPNLPNLEKNVILSAFWHLFPSKMAFGKCRRVWRVLAKRFGKFWQFWQVLAKRCGECWRFWRLLAKLVGKCWRI